ncbi:hypothetical protein BMF94_2905 [Rhodotorula taiwanensis]|uniref:Aminopeptidase P N-terminal domain-containing protein n=1 Tax=Rhodotorula taiwanensis TaxID=741276 RepID=A0A2S5BBF2_9BASI|nr:hypothetical protein BMF94_2905 [Rhodotorula taiwanensis]
MTRPAIRHLVQQARPRPGAGDVSSGRLFRFQSSAACAPLAHPTGDKGHFAPTSNVKSYGQPLPSTHPHLLQPGELTPCISANEYHERRQRLVDSLEDGAVAIIAGGQVQYMTQNIFYRFRQQSNMWYLTGFEEPDSAVVLEKNSSSKGYKMTLFCKPKEPYDELWNGARTGLDGARAIFGADEACDSAHFGWRIKNLLTSNSHGPVYIDLPSHATSTFSRTRPRSPSRSFLQYLSSAGSASKQIDEADDVTKALQKRDVRSAAAKVERLRLFKSEAEVKAMRRAADISADAHSKVMRYAQPGQLESQLVAHFEYHTSLRGATRPAYVPVCSSGAQALTIHYVENNRPIKQGEMVLIDAGCEWGGYASDITRTFPVSGAFTTAQKHLYEAVLRVEKACIKRCTERANLTLEELHRLSVDLSRTELTDLGFNLRAGDLERILYPHFLSHPLGIDLHDTRTFGRDEKIKAGMVITIEPGLYVPPLAQFPKEFHNQVVRIEDEVLVREEDSVILSVDAPKEVADVEARCQGLLDGVGNSA